MSSILVVDDRSLNRQFLVTLLGYAGHRMLEAENGVQALEITRAERPDLIITDILMPVMDGYELVRQLRAEADFASTPVMFYSATYRDREVRALAKATGVQYVLIKPAEPQTILNVVNAALGINPASTPRAEILTKPLMDPLQVVSAKLTAKMGELGSLSARLSDVIKLGLEIGAERSAQHLLENFCERARKIIDARYAAVGILAKDGRSLQHFIPSGMDSEIVASLGPMPTGKGLLGVILPEGLGIRLRDLTSDPRSAGFPPGHPMMHSFLGVPISTSVQVYGQLYFTEKIGAAEFSEEDERLALMLAAQLAAAYENVYLYDEIQRHAASLKIEMTERQQAEDEIRKINAELEQRVIERTAQMETANKELEAFAYSVAHDLRAPLRSIDSFSEILLEDYQDRLDATGQAHLQRVRDAAQRMARLINDLLDLSRVARADMQRVLVNLSAIAQRIAEELQQTEPERQVEFRIAEGLTVQADSGLLRAALENLLINAWKFTSKQPKAIIEVGAQQRGGQMTYFVHDNGVGFDMAHAGHLFGAFQRLHSTSEFPGTGIGLATVQRIIHRHGGRIWAEANPGEGATFYFTLLERSD